MDWLTSICCIPFDVLGEEYYLYHYSNTGGIRYDLSKMFNLDDIDKIPNLIADYFYTTCYADRDTLNLINILNQNNDEEENNLIISTYKKKYEKYKLSSLRSTLEYNIRNSILIIKDGQIIGFITICKNNKESLCASYDVSYILSPDHRGKNIMKHAISAFINYIASYAYENMIYIELCISCRVSNIASKKIIESVCKNISYNYDTYYEYPENIKLNEDNSVDMYNVIEKTCSGTIQFGAFF